MRDQQVEIEIVSAVAPIIGQMTNGSTFFSLSANTILHKLCQYLNQQCVADRWTEGESLLMDACIFINAYAQNKSRDSMCAFLYKIMSTHYIGIQWEELVNAALLSDCVHIFMHIANRFQHYDPVYLKLIMSNEYKHVRYALAAFDIFDAATTYFSLCDVSKIDQSDIKNANIGLCYALATKTPLDHALPLMLTKLKTYVVNVVKSPCSEIEEYLLSDYVTTVDTQFILEYLKALLHMNKRAVLTQIDDVVLANVLSLANTYFYTHVYIFCAYLLSINCSDVGFISFIKKLSIGQIERVFRVLPAPSAVCEKYLLINSNIAAQYIKLFSDSTTLQDSIYRKPSAAVCYARKSGSRFLAAEKYIVNRPQFSSIYASCVLHERWLQAEDAIIISSTSTLVTSAGISPMQHYMLAVFCGDPPLDFENKFFSYLSDIKFKNVVFALLNYQKGLTNKSSLFENKIVEILETHAMNDAMFAKIIESYVKKLTCRWHGIEPHISGLKLMNKYSSMVNNHCSEQDYAEVLLMS